MKIKFVSLKKREIFVHNNKVVNVGDIVDVPKERAEELIARNIAEKIDEAPKKIAKGVEK